MYKQIRKGTFFKVILILPEIVKFHFSPNEPVHCKQWVQKKTLEILDIVNVKNEHRISSLH